MSKKNEKNFDFMINDEIEYVGDVRLIDAESNGKVVSINEARKLAAERMCDLICINPSTILGNQTIFSKRKLCITFCTSFIR